MERITKIEKSDINTTNIGINFRLILNDYESIVFSREAMEELIHDYNTFKKMDLDNTNDYLKCKKCKSKNCRIIKPDNSKAGIFCSDCKHADMTISDA